MDNVKLKRKDYLYIVTTIYIVVMLRFYPEALYSWKIIPAVLISLAFPTAFELMMKEIKDTDEDD